MVYAFRCFAAAADENGIINTLKMQPVRILLNVWNTKVSNWCYQQMKK